MSLKHCLNVTVWLFLLQLICDSATSEIVIKGYYIQLNNQNIIQYYLFILLFPKHTACYIPTNQYCPSIQIDLKFYIDRLLITNQQYMIQLGTARFARMNRWLEWDRKYNGIFIRFPEDRLQLHTLFFAHKKIQFKHLLVGMNIAESSVAYPEGVNGETGVVEFLQDESIAKSVQFTLFGGEKKYLRNSACDHEVQIVRRTINDPKSIYGYMRHYLLGQTDTTTNKYSGKINYFLNHFYMRLTAQTYCRLKGINKNAVLDEKIRNQMLNFIGQEYENHSPAAIKKVESEKDFVQAKISATQKEIDQIQEQCDKRIQIYKMGAIFVTAAHIISFGYMIFFVDWLGWDIIEPLTYSVGVFYTLLGIRFYRKYRTDRTGDSIRQILLKIIMKPAKLIQLKDLKIRLALQLSELRRVQTRARLLKNRINFKTSLAQAFKQTTTLLT